MGEAKRRQKLDPDFGKPRPPVSVKIEKSTLTGKWLCVAVILGRPYTISPHFKYEDAVSASEQVEASFNQIPARDWMRFVHGNDLEVFIRATQSLDYEDDDEILGIAELDADGNLQFDSDINKRRKISNYANSLSQSEGQPPSFVEPTLYPGQMPTIIR